MRCEGDEDRTTQSLRRPALSRALRAPGRLNVDLTGLAFADASLMVDLALVARRVRTAGGEMVIRGAQPHILRLIELVGLHRMPGISIEAEPVAS
ncbi:MAG: STAS domain-containing protein [Solirubrobacterales bacterium]|nr:STAS domain-containing protein [Solirubrobacterales bacterium]